MRRELVSKTVEGRSQLVPVDRAGVIPVEVPEDFLPVFDVPPKPLEFYISPSN